MKPMDEGEPQGIRGPVFVGGIERSGKTYMRFMLSSHSPLVFSKRTNLWPNFYNRFGDLSQVENFERCLQAMMQNKHVRALEPDIERIRQEFWQGIPSYARLFAIVHEQYVESQGKVRWGDQTELIERFADLIFVAYPDAKIIHMIRDPRDVYEASLARKPQDRISVGDLTARWLYSADLAARNHKLYPDRYKIVRYESLVSRPEETLGEVCRFLGIEYKPAMVRMEEIPRFWKEDEEHAYVTDTPLKTDFIGRFRTGISKYEITFIQKYTGGILPQYGYSLELIQFSAAERLRFYLLEWGINLVRMRSWHFRNLVLRKIMMAIILRKKYSKIDYRTAKRLGKPETI